MSRRQQHGLALGVAAATLMLMAWGLGRPALWLDEAASVVATQRTWADLWGLLGGAEAPLVPYYALLKVTSSTVTTVGPVLAVSPEALVRWPSVVVTVLAAWALTLWLARRCPPGLALSTAALLLVTVSFSRYAQEARPYAFVLAAAVAATILWTRLIRDGRRRWVVLYALALASLVAAHVLAGSLVVAHLIAAFVTSDRQDRRSVVLRTSGAAALGLVLVSPFAVTAALQGQGPVLKGSLPAYVPPVVVDTLTVAGVLAVGLGVAGALAVGVVRAARRRYRFIARLAAAWAVVPLVVLFPLVLVRPNLLQARYTLFVLPGWAILGGLGIMILMDAVGRALAHLGGRWGTGAPLRGSVVTAATYGIGVMVIVGVAASQVDSLREIRALGGHGEDIRPALAVASRTEGAQLPIIVSPPKDSLQFAAYARSHEHRLVGVNIQRDQPSIWSTLDPYPVRKHQLRQHERVGLLLKATRTGDCRWGTRRPSVRKVRRCLPRPFLNRGYHVELVAAGGRGWIFVVITRPEACAARCNPQALSPGHLNKRIIPALNGG